MGDGRTLCRALPLRSEGCGVTTNPIEKLNRVLRRIHHNVKRWRDGTIVLRWVAIGLQEATKGFRRLKGYEGMPRLVAALRANDARQSGALAPEKKAA